MTIETDVAIIGAGFSGLYAVHKFRDELGLTVVGFDAAGGPGGTWWWNRYPGARCDIESVHYSYSFSEEIQKNWQWSERFAAQPDILRYLEYVADTLDVRKEFEFNTRVISTVWNEQTKRWSVTTEDGRTYVARFVIAASGNLSVAKKPEFPGVEDFQGEVYWTNAWPHDGVDFEGKRVGVIGTGSTGIQVIQEVAKAAGHLTVFQRTPSFVAPLRNAPVDPQQRTWLAENHADVRADARNHFLAVPLESPDPSSHLATPAERRARFDALWEKGGFGLLMSSYADIMVDQEANDHLAEYIRERIRERVKDPEVAEKLIPTDHPYGTKRPTFDEDYYEAFNRDNVDLVDVRTSPIQRVTETGLQTSDGEYPLDMLIFATGFDAVTGPLLNLGLVGRDGVTLVEHWADRPRTYLGIATSGFPNLLTITGPTSSIALQNNPIGIEDHVDFAAALVKHAIDTGAETVEVTSEAEEKWGAIVDGMLNMTLFPQANSWYMGANVPGKPRATFIFLGSSVLFRMMLADVQDTDFGGFSFDGDRGVTPPMMKLDPSAVGLVNGLLIQGAKPLHECDIDEMRATLEGFPAFQGDARDVSVTDTTYPGAAGELPARVYRPIGVDGSLPVMVFIHGGGFAAGSIDAYDKPCRGLADDLGVVVIAPSYRLAPEHPFPAAPDDVFSALKWVAEVAPEHGGDPSRIVVAGESAGGNLAAVAALRARDEGGPALAGQVLINPVTDLDGETPSRIEFANAPILTMAAVEIMVDTYVAGDHTQTKSPVASPALAASHADLPPTLIVTMECDPMCSEGEEYGRLLEQAGVPTQVVRLNGMVHGSFELAGVLPRGSEVTDAISSYLATTFHAVSQATA